MESDGYAVQNGIANGMHGFQTTKRVSSSQMKPMSVDEALPYSPFSSVVPFNSDIIPIPGTGLRSSAPMFSSTTERNEARQGLESLNQEASEPYNTSQRLQQTLEDLKQLLQPEKISHSFRTAPRNNSAPRASNHPVVSLTPLAQMLYDGTKPEYTYPTPSPTTPTREKKVRIAPKKKQPRQTIQARQTDGVITSYSPPLLSPPRDHSVEADSTDVEDSSITVEVPGQKPSNRFDSITVEVRRQKSSPRVMTPKQAPAAQKTSSVQVVITSHKLEMQTSPPSTNNTSAPKVSHPNPPANVARPTIQQEPHTPSRNRLPADVTVSGGSASRLAVVIPGPSPAFRPEDYEVLPDSPGTPQYLSKKRKRSEELSDDDLSMSLDQREKADLAFRALQDQLHDIFENEDQLQPDTIISNGYLVSSSDGLSLSASTQTKVEGLLQKIISIGRFEQTPLDDLLRVQKLSECAIKDAENADVKVNEDMGEGELDSWLRQLSTADLGIKSARTSLRMMSGGREDKQLYSEGITQAALNAFKNVMEYCIIPIVELRTSGSSACLFKLVSGQRKTIFNLLTQCRRLLALFATLVAEIELSETVINTLEFIVLRIIFVENAHAEKDSILGMTKFDALREVAMDVVAQIFLNNPSQRSGIFDEILTSLEKLPVTKQSARQFKLAEGGSIQHVSALIMKLIQISASKPDNSKEKRRGRALEALQEGGNGKQDRQSLTIGPTIISEHRAEQQAVTAIQELHSAFTPLLDTARSNAGYVVNFIVNRAMKSTKTGEAPYRNLLDLFVEDFITCLNSTDWPAAEFLLRYFLIRMVQLAEGEKTAAPAKNMALDLLGSMGAAIAELVAHVRKTATSLETGDDDLGRYLSRLAEASLEKKSSPFDLVSWSCGPYRASLEFLHERCASDPQLSSAVGFFTAEWASKIFTTYDGNTPTEDENGATRTEQEFGRLAYRLRMMIGDKRWLRNEYAFDSVNAAHARLAYAVTLLHSVFCESFSRVLNILLGSMSSEQATVRSKSLKSVTTVLETDPTILDREPAVMTRLLHCSNDPSSLVRDSALGLISKCIGLRPGLEDDSIPAILQRINDSGVGVRKRAMKLSKDIYLRNNNPDIRSAIADALLHRVSDQDDGVQELARQTIEEVWMSPFYQSSSASDTSTHAKLAMAEHIALIVKTIRRGGSVSTVLDKVLQSMLSDNAKSAAANFMVCKALVATMFDTIIDNSSSDGSDGPSARDALQVLTIFAKSNAKLFTPEQIQLLQPYTAHLTGSDDLAIYRSVVIIFRHVLPQLSKAHNEFLKSVRKDLIQSVSRLSKAILDDVVACLWIISEVLGDYSNLTRLAISSLGGIQKMKSINFSDPSQGENMRKLCRLLRIAGMCGKHCDLDSQLEDFRRSFPVWKGDSVSALLTDTFARFASPDQALEVRKSALENIGMVCQSWPKNFNSAKIYTQFQAAFEEKDAEMRVPLETISMKSFKDFLLLEEKRSETGAEGVGTASDPTAKLGIMGGGQGDGIAIALAQRFLKPVIGIALSRGDDQALLATEVMGCVVRQGLMHPKELATALIALETSQNPKIAEIAFREHRAINVKFESILEKEYMRSVQLAFTYQRDVVKNINGATLNPFSPKLHLLIEVLKMSKVKSRKRFYENLCARIDFDPEKIAIANLPGHLEFSQFIIENMAFFEYATVDELLGAITAMEKVVAGMGTGIAHSIETEIFHVSLDQPSPQADESGKLMPMEPEIDIDRLRKLTGSSMMLSSLWEARTYLRRQYGLMHKGPGGKGKGVAKDLNKAPVKAPGVNGDKFWTEVSSVMASFESKETMIRQCRSFVELLNVDQDFKIAADGDEESRLTTPSDDEDNGTPGPPGGSGRGLKRKAVSTPGGRKKRARSSSVARGRGRPKGSGKKNQNERASADLNDDEEGE